LLYVLPPNYFSSPNAVAADAASAAPPFLMALLHLDTRVDALQQSGYTTKHCKQWIQKTMQKTAPE